MRLGHGIALWIHYYTSHADYAIIAVRRFNPLVYARPLIPHFSHPERSVLKSANFPLLQRGWVFQEWMLPHRVLHFTTQELVWECRETTACKCSDTFPSWKEEFTSMLKEGRDLETWQSTVSMYHNLDLTYSSDRLRALSGMAKMFQSYRRGVYRAGLWSLDP